MREKLIAKIVFHLRADHVSDIGDKVIAAEFQSKESQHDAGEDQDGFGGVRKT